VNPLRAGIIQMLAKVGEDMRLDGFSGASEIGPAARSDGKTQSGNMILVKRAASSL
jgi:hypothetical protein